jgi:allantoate deiminase
MAEAHNAAARSVLERCELLASLSEETGHVTRRFCTSPMHQVHALMSDWLQAAGMSVEIDAIGNVIGRYEASQPGSKTLLLGSHLDSVRDAGKYDGVLGVLVALACLELLHARGERLPFAIELLGFADEEGARYQSIYIGSKVVTGTFDLKALTLLDAEGIPMAEALRAFGLNPTPALLTTARWSSESLLGYCEVHIEQGPVLEVRNLPLAPVTAIVGQERLLFQLTGTQGHAGTLPMSLRHDALCAAAEFVLAVESLGRGVPGLVATIGQLQVVAGAANVVPGRVELSLDIRHEDDEQRRRCAALCCEQAEQIGARRGVQISYQSVQSSSTVFANPDLLQRWQAALSAEGYPVFSLPSGAGHDAVALSQLTAIAMLFVRCRGGISHQPLEAVLLEDVAAAIAVLGRFLLLTAREI